MKKSILLNLSFIILLVLFVSTQNILVTNADSGWDVSYDSGSSFDSGSSNWGSSSWDSSSDSYGSSNGSGLASTIEIAIIFELVSTCFYYLFIFIPISKKISKNDQKKTFTISIILLLIRIILLAIFNLIMSLYFILDFLILFIFPIIFINKTLFYDTKNIFKNINYKDVPDSKLAEFGINNKQEFKNKLFDKYVAIQDSWMNFDYNSLRNLLTDELFNMYSSQLDVLKNKNEKNIMNSFKYIDSKIVSINKVNNIIEVKYYLNVEMYDYVVDYYNNVVRGNKNKLVNIKYEITFQKSAIPNIDTCPNCGAKILDSNSSKCIYCNAILTNNNSDWVMSKKSAISQK